jgi:hypothetical protein
VGLKEKNFEGGLSLLIKLIKATQKPSPLHTANDGEPLFTYQSAQDHCTFMAAKTQFSTLPAEVRSEIWSLALLPSPGVYRCDPCKFIFTREPSPQPLEVEDARWLIPKRRYPTVVHLCRKSRFFALGAIEKKVRENSFFYCIG